MSQKILALLFAALLSFSFVSCGNPDESSSSESVSESVSESENTPEDNGDIGRPDEEYGGVLS